MLITVPQMALLINIHFAVGEAPRRMSNAEALTRTPADVITSSETREPALPPYPIKQEVFSSDVTELCTSFPSRPETVPRLTASSVQLPTLTHAMELRLFGGDKPQAVKSAVEVRAVSQFTPARFAYLAPAEPPRGPTTRRITTLYG